MGVDISRTRFVLTRGTFVRFALLQAVGRRSTGASLASGGRSAGTEPARKPDALLAKGAPASTSTHAIARAHKPASLTRSGGRQIAGAALLVHV